MSRVAAVTEVTSWVGNHHLVFLPFSSTWSCYNCGERQNYESAFQAFACNSAYQPEKPTAPKHVARYSNTAKGMCWDCTNCGAGGKTLEMLNMVACDPIEARIHTGPASFLCTVGAGHVCDCCDEEPDSRPIPRFERLLAQMKNLHDQKRSDYTGTSGDILHNYRTSAKLAGITTAQGMFSRLCEKVVRISSVMSKGGETQVTDERLADTYFDLAVISLLCIIESEERK